MALGSAALMFRVEGHGVNGSTSVSKTESLGSNPSAPAKLNVFMSLSLGLKEKRCG